MSALGYFLSYPFLWLLGKGPFWVLYSLSDIMYFLLFHIGRYRRKVVLHNLKKAFPEKETFELKQIRKAYFRFLCDLTLEGLKVPFMTSEEILERIRFQQPEKINYYFEQGKSVLFTMGHLGNWEWAGACFSLTCKHPLWVAYKPLNNPYFDRFIKSGRTKFGATVFPMKATLKEMVKNKSNVVSFCLIADQAPRPVSTAWWTTFLNQETPVFKGPEKLSTSFLLPVFYASIKRKRRGYYTIEPILISENPANEPDFLITRRFYELLEKDIKNDPASWLWSHKRWKHLRPENQPLDF